MSAVRDHEDIRPEEGKRSDSLYEFQIANLLHGSGEETDNGGTVRWERRMNFKK